MNLYEKLVELRKVIPYMKKDKEGFNYDYVTGTSVIGTTKEKMNELKLLLYPEIRAYKLTQDIYEKTDKYGKVKVYRDWIFQSENSGMVWYDAENNEKAEIPFVFLGVQDDPAKAYGSALTYSERYFLLKFLNIATDKDDPDAFQKKYDVDEKQKVVDNLKTISETNEKIKKTQTITELEKLWLTFDVNEQKQYKKAVSDQKNFINEANKGD